MAQTPNQPEKSASATTPMEELDLTPYEEDDDATLRRKMIAARMARKRAAEDLKLLCNRIGLLKQEESKVSLSLLLITAPFAGSPQDRRNTQKSF